jgi:lysosomal acid lipase/cholesteryl ester hydrolase
MGTMKSISSVWVVTQFCITSLLLLTMLASSRSSRSSTTAQAATGAPSPGPVASSSPVAAPPAQNNSTGFCEAFIVSSDYTCSEYMVETVDGYLLAIQRIAAVAAPAAKGPAFLYHGIMEGGDIWVLNPGEESLAFSLANAGHEVWIGNTRSTIYTFGHVLYQRQQKEFWNWNWDDLVSKDLPSMLYAVYNHTQQPLFYVGYSQGSMTAFAAFSQGPLVNLVAKAAMLSPVSHVNHITSAVALAASYLYADQILLGAGFFEFNLYGEAVAKFLDIVCTSPQVDCTTDLLNQITGPNCCLNETRMPLYYLYSFQSTSMQNIAQLAQMVRTGGFGLYDYGYLGNLMNYHSLSPPQYDLSAIPASLPMLLAHGGNDTLSDPDDVANLISLLQGVPEVLYLPEYAHGDFIIGCTAGTLVYSHILAFFEG